MSSGRFKFPRLQLDCVTQVLDKQELKEFITIRDVVYRNQGTKSNIHLNLSFYGFSKRNRDHEKGMATLSSKIKRRSKETYNTIINEVMIRTEISVYKK